MALITSVTAKQNKMVATRSFFFLEAKKVDFLGQWVANRNRI
jgi:hypothetical protein